MNEKSKVGIIVVLLVLYGLGVLDNRRQQRIVSQHKQLLEVFVEHERQIFRQGYMDGLIDTSRKMATLSEWSGAEIEASASNRFVEFTERLNAQLLRSANTNGVFQQLNVQ